MKTKALLITLFLLLISIMAPAQSKNATKNKDARNPKTAVQPQSVVTQIQKIVDDAKAKGSRWTVDEWKSNVKKAIVIMSPMLKEIQNMDDSALDDSEKMSKLLTMMEDIESCGKLYEEFESIAMTTEAGKAVVEDTEWEKQLMEELGLSDLYDLFEGDEELDFQRDTLVETVTTPSTVPASDNIQLKRFEEMVAKARVESSKWNADEWKANIEIAVAALAPLMLKVDALQKKVDKDDDNSLQLLGEFSQLMKELEPYESLFDEFNSIVESNEVGKAVMDDPVWEEEIKKKYGIDHIDM